MPKPKSLTEPPPRIPPERAIGVRIRAKREELGLNFEELAALTREYDQEGIAAVTLRRYERPEGATLPGLRELRILCDALDVSADYLLRDASETEYEKWDRRDWEELKAIFNRATQPIKLPGISGPDTYATVVRQEKLKRARLHTKGTKEKDED